MVARVKGDQRCDCACHWNWGWLAGCFDRGISPSDVDGQVESYGQFLVIECKRAGEKIPAGQLKALWAQAAHSSYTVYVLYGERDYPIELWQVVPGQQPNPRPTNRDDVRRRFRAWFVTTDAD